MHIRQKLPLNGQQQKLQSTVMSKSLNGQQQKLRSTVMSKSLNWATAETTADCRVEAGSRW